MDDTSSTKNTEKFLDQLSQFFESHFKTISKDLIEWIAVVLMHSATLPSIFGLLMGISDRLPSLDLVSFVWAGLVLLFVRALLIKDMLITTTIGVGFIIQAMLLGFLVFK